MATIYTDPFMILRIHKSVAVQPTVTWTNEYHFTWGIGSPTGDARRDKLIDIANQFFRYERAFHLNVVRFDRAVWSTSDPEPPGTTPENHFTVPFPTNNIGLRVPASGYTPCTLAQVLFVGKEVGAGSEGKLFYRGVLDTSMLEGSAINKTTLDMDSATTIDLVADYATARETEIADYFEPPEPAADNVRFVMFFQPNVGPLIARAVYLTYIKGATDNKHNKKYFDINPAP